jgi:hypothetical protein
MTPRTACTAVGELLCNEFGGEYLPQEDIIDSKGFIRIQKKHSTLSELLENRLLTEKEASSLLKFACVRNPFDSLVSLYIKKKYKYQPLLSDPLSWVNRLPAYAQDMKFCVDHSFNDWIMKSCAKKVIKRALGMKPSMFHEFTEGMENINHDFQNVLKAAGISSGASIPVVNRTSERVDADYREYFSPFSRKIVEYVYDNDLKTYGYSF